MNIDIPKQENQLEICAKKLINKKEITLEDLREMKEGGVSVEDFLVFLGSEYKCLFHGSRKEISFDEELVENREGKVYASDNLAIAILKAVYSNRGTNLRYPYIINEETPLKLLVENANPETIGEKGYIYIISEKDGFINEPPGSWQYVKSGKQQFSQRIEIEKDDFNYPVEVLEK